MASISDRWRNELNSLSQKDYITLTKAILFDLPEPQITSENQYVADKIYAGLKKTEYNRIAKQKAKAKRLNSNGIQIEFNRNSNGIQSEFKLNSIQEEKREAPPPCSPSSSPPHPLNITPYNPPPEEKREESCTPGAGACVKSGGIETAREIIAYLNKVCGTRYRANVPDTLKHINARLSEGFTVDDFKRVIDRKYVDWKGTDYEKFMRPLTLFSTKFEGYLNAPEKPKPRGNAELSDEEKREILDIWGG